MEPKLMAPVRSAWRSHWQVLPRQADALGWIIEIQQTTQRCLRIIVIDLLGKSQ